MIFFKTTPKMTLRNPYTGSEVLEMSFSISADVYSDLTIGLALKKLSQNEPSHVEIDPLDPKS